VRFAKHTNWLAMPDTIRMSVVVSLAIVVAPHTSPDDTRFGKVENCEATELKDEHCTSQVVC
jgi:hypothetical protein